MGIPQLSNVIVVGKKPVANYVLTSIIMFNQGMDEVVIKGRGENISKAVDVYNALKDRLGESLELVSIEIGSERGGRRLLPFIEIKVRRVL